jgi:hypothetical protein
MGLDECDAFSSLPGPTTIAAQLKDAMVVDCQSQLGGASVGVAADPDDLLSALIRFLGSMEAEGRAESGGAELVTLWLVLGTFPRGRRGCSAVAQPMYTQAGARV